MILIEISPPLNMRHEQIWHEVLHMHEIPRPTAPKSHVIGLKHRRW